MMPDAAVEPGAKPSAHGRSEIFPAMNRLLTPAGNVRSDGGQPREGTAPASFAPEPPLFFSVSPRAACDQVSENASTSCPLGLAPAETPWGVANGPKAVGNETEDACIEGKDTCDEPDDA